jgi:hypothetical protein
LQRRWDSTWTASLSMSEIVVDAVSVNAGKVMMGGHERRRG